MVLPADVVSPVDEELPFTKLEEDEALLLLDVLLLELVLLLVLVILLVEVVLTVVVLVVFFELDFDEEVEVVEDVRRCTAAPNPYRRTGSGNP